VLINTSTSCDHVVVVLCYIALVSVCICSVMMGLYFAFIYNVCLNSILAISLE